MRVRAAGSRRPQAAVTRGSSPLVAPDTLPNVGMPGGRARHGKAPEGSAPPAGAPRTAALRHAMRTCAARRTPPVRSR
jgi:hypothetical protein